MQIRESSNGAMDHAYLILDRPDGRYGFKIKTSENSRLTAGDRELSRLLNLTALHQVRRGVGCYDLGDGIFSTGIGNILQVCAYIRNGGTLTKTDELMRSIALF